MGLKQVEKRLPNINEDDFSKYRVEEKLRMSYIDHIPEMAWSIFKFKACGYDNKEIQLNTGVISEAAINSQLTNLRNKFLDINTGNDIQFLIEALKLGIPDVVDAIESRVGNIKITYPYKT